MKKMIYRSLLIGVFVLAVKIVLSQGGPPNPPGDPTGGGPVGGAAPIEGGIGILLALGAAYGGRKLYQLRKAKSQDEPQD